MLTKSQGLELAFRASLQKMDGISKDESARRLRVQMLFLEEENEALHEQVAAGDDRIDALEEEREELQARITEAEAEMRSQARDVGTLRVCANVMFTITY